MAHQSALESWATWALSPTISAIVVTLLISLLSPLLIHYYLYRKATSADHQPTFLLLGPSGAGKTSLLTLFANSTASQTHTSTEPTQSLISLPRSIRPASAQYRSSHDTSPQPTFLLLDTPGHGKLRHHALSTLTSPSSLRGLIFVVDSAAAASAQGLTEAAEYLHDVLLVLQKRVTGNKTSKIAEGSGMKVLVAGNKQDLFSSLPVSLLRGKLEEETSKVRETRSRGLLDSGIGMEDGAAGGEEEGENWLGEYGSKKFRFEEMGEFGMEVSVVGGSVRGGKGEGGDVEGWWEWIGENL